MVAFYIVTKGKHPFGEEPDRHRNLLDGKPVYLNTLRDPAAKNLISWMLSHDPKDRPSAQEALKHPYFQPKEQQFEMLCKMGNQVTFITDFNEESMDRSKFYPSNMKSRSFSIILMFTVSWNLICGSIKVIAYVTKRKCMFGIVV
jgi:serine/threonine protein kinase